VLASLALAGCGDNRPTPAETAPFRKAVEEHLAAKSMGMKVTSFESIEIDGDSAVADVRMESKDEVYAGLKPLWQVTFKKTEGAWRVATVKR